MQLTPLLALVLLVLPASHSPCYSASATMAELPAEDITTDTADHRAFEFLHQAWVPWRQGLLGLLLWILLRIPLRRALRVALPRRRIITTLTLLPRHV